MPWKTLHSHSELSPFPITECESRACIPIALPLQGISNFGTFADLVAILLSASSFLSGAAMLWGTTSVLELGGAPGESLFHPPSFRSSLCVV